MKKFPNAFALMLGILILAWGLTFIIPKGTYQRVSDQETGRTMVTPGSYKEIQGESLDIMDLLLAIPEGFSTEAELLVLILLLGGCFYIIEKTGALGLGLQWIVDRLEGRQGIALIFTTLVFATGGATIGMQEEFIALTPVLILFCRSMGYNAFVAIGLSYGAAVVGAAFSPMNPFAVVIAQQEAELPLLSGLGFRVAFLVAALLLYIGFLWSYAKRNPVEVKPMPGSGETLTLRTGLILSLVALTFGVVTYGLLFLGWGFNEISAGFFLLGIVAGLLARFGINRTCLIYVDGMKEMTFAVVIIGLASGIPLLLSKGQVLDTVINTIFNPMEGLSPSLSALGMMGSQAVLHFPIMSYSAQAVLTMPVLIPLADLVGVSRQVCVLAYQYGAVNMDLLVPTNGALMAILAIAEIPYNRWFRFVVKPLLLIFALAAAAVVTGVLTGF